MTVYALWNGGPSYASAYMEEDVEKFESLADAVAAAQSRKDSGHWIPQDFNFVSREPQSSLTPGVSETSSMDIFMVDPRESYDPYPDYRIEVSPGTENFVATIC